MSGATFGAADAAGLLGAGAYAVARTAAVGAVSSVAGTEASSLVGTGHLASASQLAGAGLSGAVTAGAGAGADRLLRTAVSRLSSDLDTAAVNSGLHDPAGPGEAPLPTVAEEGPGRKVQISYTNQEGKFINRYEGAPDNPALKQPPNMRLYFDPNAGKWVTQVGKGASFSASGRYNFVVRDGTIWVSPVAKRAVNGIGHQDLAGGFPTDYAGQIQFSGRGNRGILRWWSNLSGHYAPNALAARNVPQLPIEQYVPFLYSDNWIE